MSKFAFQTNKVKYKHLDEMTAAMISKYFLQHLHCTYMFNYLNKISNTFSFDKRPS